MTETPFTIHAPDHLTPVVNVFRQQFQNKAELGANLCVYKDGAPLIEIYGGWADRAKTIPLTDNHLISVYSSGKAVVALIIAHLIDQDKIGYNQLVSSVWPEFTGDGKEGLTIGQLMSHQSGLPGITDPNWTAQDWYDWDKTCQTLARQAPLFPPGQACGYHPITFGFLAGEIARRADAHGRSLGQILRQDIAAPHNLDIWIGLPEAHHDRCAAMAKPKAVADLGEINTATHAAFMQKSSSPDTHDKARWLSAEFAASNIQANAKSLARIMSLALNGTLDGEVYLAEDTVQALGQSRIKAPNLVLPFTLDFAAGMMRNDPNYIYGPNPDTIGHSGWGGSCVWADKTAGITGAYAMTRQDNSLIGDKRPVALINALYANM